MTRDANGNLVVVFPATVSGSGIRAQSGFNANRIGNVTLAAPKGVVDAGEAGIGGQNVTIAATAVIGASN
ncbi:filamentous haemagglutinin family protein, partial [Methylomonas koyamae]|uniref:filamentous haemagglutinin family protein n=1 Tax=Methylomonas koyamae TaxID=702114 RepID=UPI000A50C225